MESSRFPNKPLAKINNKEMLIRVIDKCTKNYPVFAVVNSVILVNLVESYNFKKYFDKRIVRLAPIGSH